MNCVWYSCIFFFFHFHMSCCEYVYTYLHVCECTYVHVEPYKIGVGKHPQFLFILFTESGSLN